MKQIIILLIMLLSIKIVDRMLSNKPDNIRELAISTTGTVFFSLDYPYNKCSKHSSPTIFH